ncbi:MAG: hypothetical protein OXN81_04395 [Alphaproteobacteria bacterium]|nr:hypothetical protein [Alphaproteobacteria bacterium]
MDQVRTIAALAAVALVAGCATGPTPPAPIFTHSNFDPASVVHIHDEGPNTVRGQVFLRQSGGGVVTCAGREVRLIPAGEYAEERMLNLYGTVSSPARALPGSRACGALACLGPIQPRRLDTPDSRYVDHTRKAVCDAQGKFVFEKLADGQYFVTTSVSWVVAQELQGGAVMAPVKLRGGETVEIIISP